VSGRFRPGQPESPAVPCVQNTSALMPPWPKGVSGNPGGRPKLARPPSVALAELNDTPGDSIQEIVENFKAARRRAGGLVAADHKALAMFLAESDAECRTHVAAFSAVTDRLEGKIEQSVAVKSEATLVINIIDRAVQLELLRAARELPALEAEVVAEEPEP
jgi:hypothetical protein